MTRWKRAAGTAYLMNNIVHSPGESPDNRRAARYITGAIIIIFVSLLRVPPFPISLARTLPPLSFFSRSRNGSPVYRDESGPGFDETSVTNDPDSRPSSLSLPLSFSLLREVSLRVLSLPHEHDSLFIVSSKVKNARRTLGVT